MGEHNVSEATTKPSRKPPTKKPFERLTITDNYMFQAVMKNERFIKPLLEMILGKKIRKIVVLEAEKLQETGYNTRGIRMDVYIEDDENTVYDVEMQGTNKRFFGRRFRYYQGAIDVDIVKRREGFDKLKKSFIIFICDYDPFGKGWYVYPFERNCPWDSDIKIKDDTHWYVLNVKGYQDAEGHEVKNEIKELLSFMNGNDPKSDYTKMLDEAVKEVKQDDERRHTYMSIGAQLSDERDVGDYRRIVRSVRKNKRNVDDDFLADMLDVKKKVLKTIRFVIDIHPDWDDTDIAVEVLDMEADEELKAMVGNNSKDPVEA